MKEQMTLETVCNVQLVKLVKMERLQLLIVKLVIIAIIMAQSSLAIVDTSALKVLEIKFLANLELINL